MNTTPLVSRRNALKSLAATTAVGLGALSGARAATASAPAAGGSTYRIQHGRIKQSVVPWCFNPMTVPELARHSAAMGLKSVELCDPKFWPALKELGLTCAISGSHGFAKGFARTEEHEECLAVLRKRIEECAAAGVERIITFSGFRRGVSDEVGMKNMVDGLKKIVGFAETKKVTLCLEMLNSRVAVNMKGHPDYFCDDIERSVEVCRSIGSERMKVLFDIYHVQIMHGDILTRIKQHLPYIGHVHTAGVPGRNEIDAKQEINYPPLMQALVDLGYTGYVGQEFIPTRDKIASLADGVRICDV
ncbi:hydroxypyruvate isomerase family protein [Horticoccus sp. 23ND18S-11]|uniref:hydroxypyruvate isomerase family protein n=1 Tax=Horticoccus sp. 23ND18S-11 TaxID=3391832 RepID=UPI0039C8D6E0